MKCSPLRLFLGIALMLIPMGLYAQEVIELTTQKKAGETIKLKVQTQGDYSIEGVKETASKEKTKQTYTLTSSTIRIKGEVVVLECTSNDLTEIDLSKSVSLKKLTASMNHLTSVVTNNLSSLSELDLYGNQVEYMDLSSNKALTVLDLSKNNLKAIRLGGLPLLEELSISDNQLKSIDISGCDKLYMFLSYNNKLPWDQMLLLAQSINDKKLSKDKCWVVLDTESGIEKNIFSRGLIQMAEDKGWEVYDWKKTNMDLLNGTPDPENKATRPIELTTTLPIGSEISMTINGWGDIEIEGVKEKVIPSAGAQKFTLTQPTIKIKGYVTQLGCPSQQVTNLDLGDMTSLTWLYVGSNLLSSLDLSPCPNLSTLHCGKNQLKNLDVSKLKELEIFNCNNNQLTQVDLSLAESLQDLRCGSNTSLTDLRLPSSAPLTYIECGSCKISKLDLTPYKKTLGTVYCFENQITELDPADCPRLKVLYCGYNRINSLSIGKAPSLTELACGGNGVEGTLDITQAPAVTSLMCSNNKLTKILVNPKGNVDYIECHRNRLNNESVKELAKALPQDDSGVAEIYIVDSKGSGDQDNDCTIEEVKLIKSKGWSVWDNNGDDPIEYQGRETGITCPQQEKNAVSIFPNPTSEVLFIEACEPYTPIVIRTILGELVCKTTSNSIGSAQVLVASWASGTYIIEIGGKTYRFIVD